MSTSGIPTRFDPPQIASIPDLGAGIVHVDGSGNVSSSPVVSADIADGTITNADLAGGITPDKFSPAHFSARRSANTAGITGNGAVATIVFNTADIANAAYSVSTGIFTAPATGAYLFVCTIGIVAGAAAQTNGIISLVTTARTYQWQFDPYTSRNLASGVMTIGFAKVCDMAAGDTAKVNLQIAGGPGDSAIVVGGVNTSAFSGLRVA